jgi:hypothetical protein
MKRRTLDIILSAGGLLLAIVLLVLGGVLQSQADFAKSYTSTQLAAQGINFTPVEGLNGADQEPGGACLATYAGQPMTTGKQAECYANQYIALHMRESATGAGYEGATYASLGGVTRGISGKVAEAQKALDDATAAGQPTTDLQANLDALTAELGKANGLRDTMFKGETLRGLLLTVYGFSVFGELAGIAAIAAFLGGVLLFVLSILGFLHAARTPKEKSFEP